MQGIVFDTDTKQRLTRVYIYNIGSNKGVFNNFKGEFKSRVSKGDTLIAALEGYAVDTATIQNNNTILFYLKRYSIQLEEVTVRDSLSNPKGRYKQDQQDYRDIYRKGNAKDIFSIGGGNGIGAGLSIDALYNLLSKEGKNARYLQGIIERDYHQSMIDYRYNSSLVSNVTGLEEDELKDFMEQYRPSYYMVLEANDYSLIEFIRRSYKQYLRNPSANRLPPLKSTD